MRRSDAGQKRRLSQLRWQGGARHRREQSRRVLLVGRPDVQPWQNPRLDEIRDETRQWAEQTFPGGSRRDRAGEFFSAEMMGELGSKGLLGICMPEQYGGQGRPVAEQVAAFEGLGWG
ncbi:MAG TPA: acyl-CoA dehydrogenase family protein, partial [Actinobacteria bacterium]|nr:acyl-CoA dehydrogenase family protein [Actinomycetota bacterium]